MNNEPTVREGCDHNPPFSHYIGQTIFDWLLTNMVNEWRLNICTGSKLIKNRWVDDDKAVNNFNFVMQLRLKSHFLCDIFFTITTLYLVGFFAVTIFISNQAD